MTLKLTEVHVTVVLGSNNTKNQRHTYLQWESLLIRKWVSDVREGHLYPKLYTKCPEIDGHKLSFAMPCTPQASVFLITMSKDI